MLLAARFENFILKPTHIQKVWEGTKMKEDIFEIF
jgi:hypothetical protein